ncbi:MAG: DUF1343 domain-containing protein [Candidatus Methanomethylicia archaeon]
MGRVKIGLEVMVEDEFRDVRGKNIGIVANQSSLTPQFTHIIDEAKSKGKCIVKRVFTPEHGFSATERNGKNIYGERYEEEYDVKTYSLYGDGYKPPKEKLIELDALLFDLQDVGARWYTYISTLYYCLEACGEAGIPITVLDRPNPLTGEIIEGPILESKYKSFIGIAEIPVRYGLTIGELANYLNQKYNLKAELKVVIMENWRREYWFHQTGLPWIPPSPNMPTPETAEVYIGTCLIEATNISEGRGTVKPFQIIGSPWIKPKKLAEELNKSGLTGVMFRPITFKPTMHKYRGRICGGVEIHVTERENFRPFLMGLQIISTIKRLYLEKFRWRKTKGAYMIDLLSGTNSIRRAIDDDEDPWSIVDEMETKIIGYAYEKEKYHIY